MQRYDSMVNPPIEGLLEAADSKFRLVTVSAKRSRQINSYFGQLGEGLGASIPPQITSTSRKPLSIDRRRGRRRRGRLTSHPVVPA